MVRGDLWCAHDQELVEDILVPTVSGKEGAARADFSVRFGLSMPLFPYFIQSIFPTFADYQNCIFDAMQLFPITKEEETVTY